MAEDVGMFGSFKEFTKGLSVASGELRASAYDIGKHIPIHRAGLAPIFDADKQNTKRAYDTAAKVLETGRARAGARITEINAQLSPNDRSTMHKALTRGKERVTRRIIENVETNTGKPFIGDKYKRSKGYIGKTITAKMAGTGGGFMGRPYQHALFNPRNAVIGGIVGGSVALANKYRNFGDTYFTESAGGGSGTGRGANLGPASVRGLRFRTMGRRRLI